MDKEKDNLATFSLSIYGDITNYNEVLSKARCRIFYTGPNRNGTYITEEFAEKLISTWMGDDVEVRRAHIFENAEFNKEDTFIKYRK